MLFNFLPFEGNQTDDREGGGGGVVKRESQTHSRTPISINPWSSMEHKNESNAKRTLSYHDACYQMCLVFHRAFSIFFFFSNFKLCRCRKIQYSVNLTKTSNTNRNVNYNFCFAYPSTLFQNQTQTFFSLPIYIKYERNLITIV